MIRKCGFVLLSVFLRTYGASPQVVAASLVLIAAASAHLQHRPYQDPVHNWLESVSLHVCLLQLLVTLMSNMVGRVDRNVSESPLGLQSTVVVIFIVFASTGYFFWEAVVWTVHKSREEKGAIGGFARCCAQRLPRICSDRAERGAESRRAVEIVPVNAALPQRQSTGDEQTHSTRTKFDYVVTMRALESQRRTSQVATIKETARKSKVRLLKKIQRSKTHQNQRLQARLAARAKVKQARALEKSAPFASLDADSISKIIDMMDYRDITGTICQEGAPADKLFILVKGSCTVTIRGRAVARLEELAVFGESSLFGGQHATRNATVAAADGHPIKLLVLARKKWERLVDSGVLSAECVAALRAVQAARTKMNAKGPGKTEN